MADGCIVGQSAIDRLARAEAPTLLTLPDQPDRDAFERIDAGARWAGLALLDGGRLRATAGMLGDWDLESTLLRRTVQEGAGRLSIYTAQDGGSSAGLPLIAENESALADLEKTLLAESQGHAPDWPARLLFAPLEEPAARLLLKRSIDAEWIAMLAAGLAVVALPLAAAGWAWGALALLLVSGPVRAVAHRLGAVKLAAIRRGRLYDRLRAAAATGVLLAFAGLLAEQGGWGWWMVSAMTIAAMLALRNERAMLARTGGSSGPVWLASVDSLIWGFLPFAVIGEWRTGLAALALYALASFAFVQRLLSRKLINAQIVEA